MNYATVERAIRGGHAPRIVPMLCRRALDEIVAGRCDITAVRHPLGFLCLPVYRDGEYGVCVHLWSPGVTLAHAVRSPVHSHSWDLVSFVLFGQVGNTVLQVVDDAVTGTHRIFEIRSRGDIDEVRATPRLVRCQPARHRAAGPGGTYRLRAGRFHASVIEGEPEAATVVLGRTRATPDLLVGPPDGPSHRICRQRCGAQETAEAARIVVDRLARAAGADGGTGKG